jgi:hypothetical protein
VSINWDMIAGLFRHLLTFGGGWMVAKGFFDEATMNELVAGLMTVIGIVWSVVQKRRAA